MAAAGTGTARAGRRGRSVLGVLGSLGRGARRAGPPRAGAGARAAVRVTFAVGRRLEFGAALGVAGSAHALGAWQPERALMLTWSEGDVWRGEASVEPGEEVRFKLVTAYDNASFVWDEGEDVVFRVPMAQCEEIAVVADGLSTTVLVDGACLAEDGGDAGGAGEIGRAHV